MIDDDSKLSVEDNVELIARIAHLNQIDKAGHPYIEHVIRVANMAGTDSAGRRVRDLWIVGMLHDVVEDTGISGNELVGLGMPRAYWSYISAITRRSTETYFDYIKRVRASGPVVRAVKIADLHDHLDRSGPQFDYTLPASLRDRYVKALDYLLMTNMQKGTSS